MSGISKTIPASAGRETLDSLYDGSLKAYEFHMAGNPNPDKLKVGEFVYTIFADQLVGRLQISRIKGGAVHPASGRPRTLVYVTAPGEKLATPVARKSHRGTRYMSDADWPTMG